MSDRSSHDSHERFDPAVEPMLQIKQTSFDQMQLQPGQRALDVGCGTGSDTLALARIVGSDGLVHGVDYDAAMIAKARQRADSESMATRVAFHHANAAALPWPDGYFHASRSDRVLQHMLEPARAFDELLRVTRSGGRVVVISGDWATQSVDLEEPDIESRRAHFLATLTAKNDVSGGCLYALFMQRGLLDLHTETRRLVGTGSDANQSWQRSTTPEAIASGLFASANVIMISGRKA